MWTRARTRRNCCWGSTPGGVINRNAAPVLIRGGGGGEGAHLPAPSRSHRVLKSARREPGGKVVPEAPSAICNNDIVLPAQARRRRCVDHVPHCHVLGGDHRDDRGLWRHHGGPSRAKGPCLEAHAPEHEHAHAHEHAYYYYIMRTHMCMEPPRYRRATAAARRGDTNGSNAADASPAVTAPLPMSHPCALRHRPPTRRRPPPPSPCWHDLPLCLAFPPRLPGVR